MTEELKVDNEQVVEQRDQIDQVDQEDEFLLDIPEGSPRVVESRGDMRALTFNILYIVDRSDYQMTASEVLENLKAEYQLVVESESFAETVATAVIAEREALDKQIEQYLRNWTINRIGCATKLILRMALWELAQPAPEIPVIINEAIELAKDYAEKDAYRFVNGLLERANFDINPELAEEAEQLKAAQRAAREAAKSGDTEISED